MELKLRRELDEGVLRSVGDNLPGIVGIDLIHDEDTGSWEAGFIITSTWEPPLTGDALTQRIGGGGTLVDPAQTVEDEQLPLLSVEDVLDGCPTRDELLACWQAARAGLAGPGANWAMAGELEAVDAFLQFAIQVRDGIVKRLPDVKKGKL